MVTLTPTTRSFISSSPPLFFSHFPSPSISFQGHRQKSVLISLKCSMQDGDNGEGEKTKTTPSSSALSSWSDSTYKWCAGIGASGFAETAYLSYLKLTNSDAFCPVGTGGIGSCGDVLNSDYALVFGVPLPFIGMLAYGSVALLGILLARKSLPVGVGEGHLIIHGITSSMAVSSAYFLYILSNKLSGASCPYCLASAFLSFSLFFITLKEFGFQGTQKLAGVQLIIAALVVTALSTSYSTVQPASSLAEIELPYFTTEITAPSTPFSVALARHLHSIGAKMYGAFWCSHCQEQKQMFGREAFKVLDYVECFPEGYRKGTKIEKACSDAKIEGFPTWVINGQVFSGEQELSNLAEASGFQFEGSNPPK